MTYTFLIIKENLIRIKPMNCIDYNCYNRVITSLKTNMLTQTYLLMHNIRVLIDTIFLKIHYFLR